MNEARRGGRRAEGGEKELRSKFGREDYILSSKKRTAPFLSACACIAFTPLYSHEVTRPLVPGVHTMAREARAEATAKRGFGKRVGRQWHERSGHL